MSLLHKIIVLLLSAGLASASVNIETWDGPGIEGWEIEDVYGGVVYGSLNWASSLGGRSGALRITGGAADTDEREDLIFTTGGGLANDIDYTGGGLSVRFDFYVDGALPQQLDVYVLSNSEANNYAWFLDVTPSLSQGWNTIYASLAFGAGWYNQFDGRTTSSEFVADLADIDAIGVRLWYNLNDGGQIYGLDNFDVVPEPETWAFLGIAFLSIGYSFREKIDKSMAALMVRVRGC